MGRDFSEGILVSGVGMDRFYGGIGRQGAVERLVYKRIVMGRATLASVYHMMPLS